MGLFHSAAASVVPTAYPILLGGDVTFDGDYAIHTFTSVGTSSLQINSSAASINADILVVGGGGGAGRGANVVGVGYVYAGGGGGGGVVYLQNYELSTGVYDVIVGAGGPNSYSGSAQSASFANGKDSYLGPVRAYGGGGAPSSAFYIASFDGLVKAASGGSPGGLGPLDDASTTSCMSAAVMNTLTGSVLQTGEGGHGNLASLPSDCVTNSNPPFYKQYRYGSGGGGAGGPASNATGGIGYTVSIRGVSETYGAGGDSGNFADGGNNTGNGGSSGTDGGFNDGVGGSGIVIIRYKYK